MEIIQKINSIQEVQDAIVNKLKENVFYSRASIPVFSENSAQIEYLIKNAISKLGVCCVVQTPTLDFYGKDKDGHPVWQIPEFTIVISEIPTTNRSRAGASTALDAALIAAETVNELGSEIALNSINQLENNGVISVFVSFKSSILFGYTRNDLD